MAKRKQEPVQVEEELPKLPLQHCLNAARSLINAYDEWHQADGPHAGWRGMTVKAISQKLHVAIQNACDATADTGYSVEGAARKYVLIFDDLAAAFTRWIQEASLNQDTAPPRGNSEIHTAIERLKAAMKTNSLPKPDPIEQLINLQRVSPQQVAMIYGWKLEDGSGDTQKVFEELNKPGTHFNPETWVHPALKAEQAETDLHWANREFPRGKLFGGTDTPEEEAVKNEERLDGLMQSGQVDEMFKAGASVAQMLRYLRVEEDMLTMLADDRGYVVINDCFVSKEKLEQDAAADKFKETVGS
jgi:hypothetical protein